MRTTAAKQGPKRAKKSRPAGALTIDRSQDCYLFCFSDDVRPDAVLQGLFTPLLEARVEQPGNEEWVVFHGFSPSHWLGMRQWVLLSANVPAAALAAVRENLHGAEYIGAFESNEVTTPARELFVEPVFSFGPEIPCVLVPEGGAAPQLGQLIEELELPKRTWRAKARR